MLLSRRFIAGLMLALLGLAPAAPLWAQPAGSVQGAKAAEVLEYEDDNQLLALAKQGATVVFFFAEWCPNCQATIAELNENWASVKPGLSLVIADFDKEAALKKRLGVTYQDTFVQIGPDGRRLRIWNAGGVSGRNANTIAPR